MKFWEKQELFVKFLKLCFNFSSNTIYRGRAAKNNSLFAVFCVFLQIKTRSRCFTLNFLKENPLKSPIGSASPPQKFFSGGRTKVHFTLISCCFYVDHNKKSGKIRFFSSGRVKRGPQTIWRTHGGIVIITGSGQIIGIRRVIIKAGTQPGIQGEPLPLFLL